MTFNNFAVETDHLINENNISFQGLLYTYLVLPFNMEHQTQSNWCWAATSKSVSKFYSAASPWTQCSIAGGELGKTCCTSPVPAPCNVPWYLDKALTRTHNFISVQGGTITWQQVKQQLQAGLVVGTRIGWNHGVGGGGHFMTIHGVSNVGLTQYLHIDDPIYGKSVLTYNQFATNYQGNGNWTHTYFTKKYFYSMWFKELPIKTELLKPITDVRPLLNVSDKKVKENTNVKYSIPHNAYIINLNEIKADFNLPSVPKTLRVMEIQDETPIALYEVGTNEARPELVQMNVSETYFRQLDSGLEKLKKFSTQHKELGEVRFIKIPGLNIEAFWLHYENAANDIISPLKKFENDSSLDWDKSYDEKQFKQLIQELASKVDLHDDLLGA